MKELLLNNIVSKAKDVPLLAWTQGQILEAHVEFAKWEIFSSDLPLGALFPVHFGIHFGLEEECEKQHDWLKKWIDTSKINITDISDIYYDRKCDWNIRH